MSRFWREYFRLKKREVVAVVEWVWDVIKWLGGIAWLACQVVAVYCGLVLVGVGLWWDWRIVVGVGIFGGLCAWHIYNVRKVRRLMGDD